MRKLLIVSATSVAMLALAACGGGRQGVMGRAGPDEFAVARRAPLVIPPDFALVPPKPGAPRPQEADSSTQALSAMFGGQAQRSAGENALIDQAGRATDPGIRSEAGDSTTDVVNKGAVTRDILNAPASTTPEASATTPQ
ncbi:hypothetical protein CLG96_07025 [Sphingomonas oleivorans]|uniref:DUF3035 domain-containing protein n=1 Tax=Sphingomonas oleivorans TaxID=1735121 RepID=A0A2T5FZZ6_9SPHN|nr:DUF3035 domain-containing protein [Sphingomonas oleivorans]PTQ12283.1 hypothetical protein CLG96_07025 [Sphingomonas oleivorans]